MLNLRVTYSIKEPISAYAFSYAIKRTQIEWLINLFDVNHFSDMRS